MLLLNSRLNLILYIVMRLLDGFYSEAEIFVSHFQMLCQVEGLDFSLTVLADIGCTLTLVPVADLIFPED
jgi:hypothetical protein